MLQKNEIIIKFSLVLSILLFGAAAFLKWESMWGYNHLIFLDSWVKYLFAFALVLAVALLFIKDRSRIYENLFEKIDHYLWGGKIYFPLLITTVAILLFFWFRLQTYFLGDGYTIISIFENSQSYIHKSTEYLSTLLIRYTQLILGGYSKETSLLTLKLLSFVSGFITILLFFYIIRRLFKSPSIRILAFATLFFSGAALLFFGYVEFYPMLWASVAVYLYFVTRFFETRKGLFWVILSFIIAAGIHAQAIYLIGGVALLVLYRYYHDRPLNKLPNPVYIIIGFLTLVVTGIFIWKILYQVEFALNFLPFYSGRPRTPGYGIFSPDHLFDIINQSLLILPGILVLITAAVFLKPKLKWFADWKLMFFTLSSAGSIIFLFVIEPYIGMARDWDLMSLTLLMPALLLIYIISKSKNSLSPVVVVSYVLLCLVASRSFAAVNVNREFSEKRYHSLLANDDDNRSRNGWMILANYYFGNSQDEKAKSIIIEMNRRFPQYVYLDKAHILVEQGNFNEANKIAKALLDKDPNNVQFLELMGKVHTGYRRYTEAEECYNKALLMNPYSISIRNNLAILEINRGNYARAAAVFEKLRLAAPKRLDIVENLASSYINLKEYHKAGLLADSLFRLDKNSPTAHLIMLSVTAETGNLEKAKLHYEEFGKYATNRPDYNAVLEYFKNINE